MATDGERLAKLENQMDNIENKVDEGFDRVEKRQDAMQKILTDFIKESENRYASKWVEKVVWGVASLIGASVVIAGLSLILAQ